MSPFLGSPAYLANRLLGVRIAADGSGLPNSLFVADRYDASENLVAQPNPLCQGWSLLQPELNGYSQELDLRTAALTTKWRQRGLSVESETVLHPDRKVIAQSWKFRWNSGSPPKFDLPKPSKTLSFIEHRFAIPGPNGEGTDLEEVWTLDGGPKLSFREVAQASKETWVKRWKTDIVIDGPLEDQAAVRSWLFYLRSTVGGPLGGLSPFGLSSARYLGHIFWDADIWTFPSLCLIDPEAAAAIPQYRLRHQSQSTNRTDAPIPWQSAVSAKELAPPPFQKEIHVVGDCAFMLEQAAALGLTDSHEAKAYLERANIFFRSRSRQAPDGLNIPDVLAVDEYHEGDNDFYTNCIAQWISDHTAAHQSYHLPHDGSGFLTYDGDPNLNYQQADAILGVYPLQDPRAVKAEKAMIERFPPKTSTYGPAMSESLEALIRAKFGDNARAYGVWKRSWMDYQDPNFALFKESRQHPDTCFLTGAAGCLQTVLYGFIGFGIDWQQNRQAVWSAKLKEGHQLTIQPHLPSAWRSVTLRNFIVLGRPYTLTVTQKGATVTEGEP
jgi:trehalose/maltose hydrolase-like predicted phosphorylase